MTKLATFVASVAIGAITAGTALAQAGSPGANAPPPPAQPNQPQAQPNQSQAQANPAQSQTPPPTTPAARMHNTVASVQQKLQDAGLYSGDIDGLWGPQTRAALRQFQHAHNLRPTGELNAATVARLGLAGNAEQPTNSANNPQQNSYQARNGLQTRPGAKASALGGGYAPVTGPGDVTGSVTSASPYTSPPPTGSVTAPSGYFGYGNLSNGFNAAAGINGR